ncbi:MAG: bifunctional diaminohydroxyphosphoribosylaminopyrimidine deaminase/5-amino-6-(5-phosphoribosylamino)uracil reductase RibD, partial [Bacteroidetes bacterium]
GWHKKFGEVHAEVNAVNSVVDKGLLTHSIFYISLEPCSFYGKTPACTDLILNYKPKTVVIASKDPNPKVSGAGIKILENAGIEVIFGVLEEEAIVLNKQFYVSMIKNRPYIILKWAQTEDGFIARTNFDSKWISNKQSRQLVHKWRTEEDAILVGYNTVIHDDPQLTARNWQGRNPTRVVIDRKLELSHSQKIFEGVEKIYVVNTQTNQLENNIENVKVSSENFIVEMLTFLWEQNIGSIIIEGGAKTLNSFLDEELWDEARIFTSATTFGDGIPSPKIETEADEEQNIMGDRLNTIYNPKTKILWQKK